MTTKKRLPKYARGASEAELAAFNAQVDAINARARQAAKQKPPKPTTRQEKDDATRLRYERMTPAARRKADDQRRIKASEKRYKPAKEKKPALREMSDSALLAEQRAGSSRPKTLAAEIARREQAHKKRQEARQHKAKPKTQGRKQTPLPNVSPDEALQRYRALDQEIQALRADHIAHRETRTKKQNDATRKRIARLFEERHRYEMVTPYDLLPPRSSQRQPTKRNEAREEKPKPAGYRKPHISVRQYNYNGNPGYLISGRDEYNHHISIFSRSKAEAIRMRDDIKAGREPEFDSRH